MVITLAVPIPAQERIAQKNFEVMEDLLRQITGELILQSHVTQGESVAVHVTPTEENQIFENILATTFRSKGIRIFQGKDSIASGRSLLTLPTTTLGVEYSNLTRDGFFGAKKVTRSISAVVFATIENTMTHEVTFSGDLKKYSIDTVEVSEIDHLETPSLKWTHGEVPQENVIDRAIEPFVIIGATGIAIYLFFHIRS